MHTASKHISCVLRCFQISFIQRGTFYRQAMIFVSDSHKINYLMPPITSYHLKDNHALKSDQRHILGTGDFFQQLFHTFFWT